MTNLKNIILTTISVLATLISIGQNSLQLSSNFDLGVGKNSYGDNGNTLKGKIPNQLNSNISLIFTTRDRFTFEIGVGQAVQNFNIKDIKFEDENSGFNATVSNKNMHPIFFGSVGYIRPITDRLYSYGKFGVAYNSIDSDSISKEFKYDKLKKTMFATTNYTGSSFSLAPEFGFQLKTASGFHFHAGLKVSIGLDEVVKGKYTVQTVKEVNGEVATDTYSDTYKSQLTWVGVNVGASYVLFKSEQSKRSEREEELAIKSIVEPIKDEKEKKKKTIRKEEKPETVVLEEVKVEKAKTIDLAKVDLPDRKHKVGRKFHIKNKKVMMELFDGAIEDGDSVSVKFNGKWIVYKYELTKKKKFIELELEEGTNLVELFAHNLGRISPNTSRLYIVDGRKRHITTVRSHLDQNGSIELIYEPKTKK